MRKQRHQKEAARPETAAAATTTIIWNFYPSQSPEYYLQVFRDHGFSDPVIVRLAMNTGGAVLLIATVLFFWWRRKGHHPKIKSPVDSSNNKGHQQHQQTSKKSVEEKQSANGKDTQKEEVNPSPRDVRYISGLDQELQPTRKRGFLNRVRLFGSNATDNSKSQQTSEEEDEITLDENNSIDTLKGQLAAKTTEMNDFVQQHGQKIQTMAEQLDKKDDIILQLNQQLEKYQSSEVQMQQEFRNTLSEEKLKLDNVQEQKDNEIKLLKEEHVKEIQSLKERVQDLTQQLDTATLSHANEQVKNWDEMLSQNESELAEAKFKHAKEVELLSLNLSDKNQIISDMTVQLREADRAAQKTIQTLQETNSSQKDKLHDLTQLTYTLQQELEEFKSKVSDYEQVKTDLQDAQTALKQIKSDKEQLAQELVQFKLSSDDTQVVSSGHHYLQMENDTLMKEKDGLANSLESVQKSERFLLKEKEDLMANITKLSIRLADSKAQVDFLQMQLEDSKRNSNNNNRNTGGGAIGDDDDNNPPQGSRLSNSAHGLPPSTRSLERNSSSGRERNSRFRQFISKS